MSQCFLCGQDEPAHHMGCARIDDPKIDEARAAELGLMSAKVREELAQETTTEIYHEGSMTPEVVEGGGETREQCEFDGCENMKASASARAKYCADHKDPKNRKE